MADGTTGADILQGTNGNDTINALAGNDTVYGSNGTDNLDGGAGYDKLIFDASKSYFSFAPNSQFTLTDALFRDGAGSHRTTLSNFEEFQFLYTGNFSVRLDTSAWTGSEEGSFYSGVKAVFGSGADTFIGGSRAATITIGEGNNGVSGGSGRETVVVNPTDLSQTLEVFFSGGTANVMRGTTYLLRATNIEGLVFGETSRDYAGRSFSVDASQSTTAISFTDTAGDDTFIGGAGNDFFAAYGPSSENSGGIDTYTGGGGNDYYDFTSAAQGFDKTTITDFAPGDVIDLSGNNSLSFGKQYISSFIGTQGFSGVRGQLRYEYSNGQTRLQFDGDGDGVADGTLLITNGAFNLKTVPSILYYDGSLAIGISGSVSGNAVRGSPANDVLTGSSQGEPIYGEAGDDRITGGLGADSHFGGDGTDTASFADNYGSVFVNLTTGQGFGNAAQGETFKSIENLLGSIFADFFIGDDGVNRLDGAEGDDTLLGGLGADQLVGGEGTDTASYEDNYGTAFVNLAISQGFNNAAEGDTFEGIENLIGGVFDDFFIGNDNTNRLDGAMGADTLVGNGGADIFMFTYAPGATSGYGKPNVDLILDFKSGEDKIELSSAAFTGLAAGALPASAFVAGTAAADADDRIIYDQATGRLFFDADGTGAGAAVLFATLGESSHSAIAAMDFAVV